MLSAHFYNDSSSRTSYWLNESTLNSYCVLRTLIFLMMDNCSVCVLSVMLAQNIAFPLPILDF